MSKSDDPKRHPTRRGFLASTGGLIAVAGSTLGAGAATEPAGDVMTAGQPAVDSENVTRIEPVWGAHQGGIVTRLQSHSYFATFDLSATAAREDIVKMLRAWTAAAARLIGGQTAETLGQNPDSPSADTGEALGLPPARLTLTFGFGPGLFVKDGKDRYGLAKQRPEAFIDMPHFPGDQLAETHTGGDLSVQACADDPQVAFHAVRQLARLAYYVADLRWTQTGFMANFGGKQTPRNLMGFKDGTNNPSITDAAAMEKFVWAGSEAPAWMRGGSYLVVRRIRIALEHWDRMKLGFQEQTVGRHKYSGAPLGKVHEFDPANLKAVDKDSNPVIPENAHIRLAGAASNDGARILRRPYSYNDGTNFVAERWPPWRQGMEYDAGLFFVAYQRDPRTGFIKIYDNMAKLDMMNQFATHVGGGYFACPGGMAPGEFIGQRLFTA
jgi:deferrochelatase/peroxidase EfeB